ncbi:MAG: sulfatase [Bryobacteraceae bacterium]
MRRRDFLRDAALLLGGGALAAQTQPKLNFIVIFADDLGWADLGCYGSKVYETPNLDRLASEGVRFTNGYAACPVCSPTRASLLTGKYPARLHLTDWIPGRKQWPTAKLLTPAFEQQLPLEEVTIAEALKPAGYVSASIGKWHLGGHGFYPEAQGFDLNLGGTERGSPPSYFAPYKIPGLDARSDGEYLTDHLTWRAERFIEENRGRPFFLYLPHFAVHTPLQAKEEMIARYGARIKPGDAQNDPVYAAMVESLDEGVGRIQSKVRELGLEDRTVIVFVSDNGGLRYEGSRRNAVTSNAPLRAGKGHLYEGGIRVPLIVKWPGRIKAGAISDAPVSTIDLFPTILAMAGVRQQRPVDGVDLTPALTGSGRLRRNALYWHYPHYSNQGGVPGAAVRIGNFKLIEFYEDMRLELYDLGEDIGEQRNLVQKLPGKAKELHRALVNWRRSVKAAMPSPNPAYDPEKADQGLTGKEPPTPPV